MNIYAAEASVEGLAERIQANQSVTYSAQILPWTPNERESFQENLLKMNFKAEAKRLKMTLGSTFDEDLFFTKSIFVSTNWNLNDDVFSPAPVWAARHTPSHKPTNIEHDETRLVGHITETWALDGDGNLIPDNTVVDDLPALYHLANGAVIYTNWRDDNLVARTQELIGQIQAGEKFVSMEALFAGFDYALVTPDEKYHVVARTQDTAFLTKHLRIYGGNGQYDGCSIGRLLKHITFCGKGYVDKPANPYSVIFNDSKAFDFSSASEESPFKRQSGVLIYSSSHATNQDDKSETSMSDTLSVELLQKNNDKLEATVSSLQVKVEELTKASSEAGVQVLEAKVVDLEGKLEVAQSTLTEVKASVETLETEKADLTQKLTEANEAKSALEKDVEDAKAAQAKADRVAKLVDAGVDKAVAEEKVELYANLNDDQFSSISEDIVSANKDKMSDDEKKKKKEKDDAEAASNSEEDINEDSAAANADESVLEDAQPDAEDVALSSDASDEDTDDLSATRKELQQTLAGYFGNTEETSENTDDE